MSRGQTRKYAALKEQAYAMAKANPLLTHVEIGQALGVSRSTAYRWFHGYTPKSWGMTGTCPLCGGVMHEASKRCRKCYDKPERREEIIRRYNEGQTPWSIALGIGEDYRWTEHYIQKLKARGLIQHRSKMRTQMRDVKMRAER